MDVKKPLLDFAKNSRLGEIRFWVPVKAVTEKEFGAPDRVVVTWFKKNGAKLT